MACKQTPAWFGWIVGAAIAVPLWAGIGYGAEAAAWGFAIVASLWILACIVATEYARWGRA